MKYYGISAKAPPNCTFSKKLSASANRYIATRINKNKWRKRTQPLQSVKPYLFLTCPKQSKITFYSMQKPAASIPLLYSCRHNPSLSFCMPYRYMPETGSLSSHCFPAVFLPPLVKGKWYAFFTQAICLLPAKSPPPSRRHSKDISWCNLLSKIQCLRFPIKKADKIAGFRY